MNRTDMNKQIKGYKAGDEVAGPKKYKRKKPKKMSVAEGIKNALLNVGKNLNPIEDIGPVSRFIPPGTVSQAGKDFSQGVKRGFSNVGDTAKQGLSSLIGGLKKKNMKKGGKVKKSSRPRGCGIAKKGVRKAKYI